MKPTVDLVPSALTVGLVQNITVLPEREAFCFTATQENPVSLMPCREMLFCVGSSLLYTVKGDSPPWETFYSL